jgi:hypothetical protein
MTSPKAPTLKLIRVEEVRVGDRLPMGHRVEEIVSTDRTIRLGIDLEDGEGLYWQRQARGGMLTVLR